MTTVQIFSIIYTITGYLKTSAKRDQALSSTSMKIKSLPLVTFAVADIFDCESI